VIAPEARGDGALDIGDLEYRRIFSAAADRYRLTFADPGASAVARVLNAADQLVLVAPASPDAARALAMTQEWLGAHGYHALTATSITVVNGLSKRSLPHAEQAELVVRGRCRAIVRVPWDDHLAGPKAERGVRNSLSPGATASRLGQLRPPVLQAYTALAGVLVAALAASPQRRRPPR
jgi:MinD-like ATPase involved in chromosome partitioning or flagellar assembly